MQENSKNKNVVQNYEKLHQNVNSIEKQLLKQNNEISIKCQKLKVENEKILA